MEYLQAMWDGPGHLRYFLQPAVAILLALRDGRADARLGKEPYVVSIFHERAALGSKLRRLVQRLTVPLCVAIGVDLVLQEIIRGHVRPLFSAYFAALFVVVPYVLVRALTNRAARHRSAHA